MPSTPDEPERWQNKITSLKQGIQKIYENEEFSDVVFCVGGKRFKAHRLVLAARCSEFTKLMDPNQVDEIIVENETVTEIGFEILLRFIYTDTLGTDDKGSIVKAYLAADFYKQNELKKKCEEQMDLWSISVDEVCELLNASLEIQKLKEKCLTFIKNNALDVIGDPEASPSSLPPPFFKLNYKALRVILENNALESVDLKTRIKRIIEWGANLHTTPVDYSLVRKDFLGDDPSLLSMLGIEKLTSGEFDDLFTENFEGLLTAEEFVKFMKYFKSKNADHLPNWCKKAVHQ